MAFPSLLLFGLAQGMQPVLMNTATRSVVRKRVQMWNGEN